MILVIPHTFGRHLNFNCHLHVLVSEGGLDADGTAWRRAPLDRKALMPMWRYAVITYLRAAYRMGVLKTDLTARQLAELLRQQYERWWNIHIQRFKSKRQFLGYAGRYARRPPDVACPVLSGPFLCLGDLSLSHEFRDETLCPLWRSCCLVLQQCCAKRTHILRPRGHLRLWRT